MKRTYKNSKKPLASVKPSTLNLQTRPFQQSDTSQAHKESDNSVLDSKNIDSESILEKLISAPISESTGTPVQKKHFASSRSRQMPIQAKLNIGEPNDKYEQEADNTATRVVQQINSVPQNHSVQRNESTEEELQMKPISSIQRSESMELEEEELQTKSLVQREENLDGGEASHDLESSIQNARGSGQSLDTNLQTKMGQAMGADFSRVKVHTDTTADQLNKSIQAKAFTTGQDVFFREGAYDPSSKGGQELIAHELTHVVQQNNGSVRRSMHSHISSVGQTIQRDGTFAEKAGRAKRIVSRFFKKKLPTNTYRWDQRTPDVIAQSGFQPWKATGNIRLDEHVNNVLDSGALAKYESQWVSTGAYGMIKKLDPTFAQQVLSTHLYKIDTALAKQTGSFNDANDYFDKKGKKRPYASQREWVKLGGIPPEAIVAWMLGKDYFDQYDMKTGAPAESALTGWQKMPTDD